MRIQAAEISWPMIKTVTILTIRAFPDGGSGGAPTPWSRAPQHAGGVAATFRSGDALFAFDENMEIVSWNDAAEELTGVSAEEAIGRPCWDVLSGVDERGGLVCHKGCSSARLARQSWPVSAQELLIKSSGGRRRVMVSTVAVESVGEAPVFLHVMRDGLETSEVVEEEPTRPPELTPRQLEVLEALASGEPAKAIALRLGIAETTARNHIRMILVELGCHSQLEAVAEARRRRLLP
jgi:PAS domain S-box-containing protein